MTLELINADVREAYVKVGMRPQFIFPGDAFYSITTPAWVMGPAAEFVTDILEQLGYEYTEEGEDCEDYAFRAMVEIKHAHAVTLRRRLKEDAQLSPSGISFGAMFVPRLEHSICTALHLENGVIVPAAYEPQPTLGGLSLVKLSLRPLSLSRADWESVAPLIP